MLQTNIDFFSKKKKMHKSCLDWLAHGLAVSAGFRTSMLKQWVGRRSPAIGRGGYGYGELFHNYLVSSFNHDIVCIN